jgi:RimJ/RimL family protein N-acetyltransferase
VESRDERAFMEHWATKVLGDPTGVARTIELDGRVAGNVVSFLRAGRREVGYWVARELWGRGVATEALRQLLGEIAERPLHAIVARHNVGSRRVLEKCGFALESEDGDEIVLALAR